MTAVPVGKVTLQAPSVVLTLVPRASGPHELVLEVGLRQVDCQVPRVGLPRCTTSANGRFIPEIGTR